MRPVFGYLLLSTLLLLACGGPQQRETVINEEGDDDPTETNRAPVQAELPAGLNGSNWRFVEASCTSGDPTFLEGAYESQLEVREEEVNGTAGITLLVDESFPDAGCQRSLIYRAELPAEEGQDLQVGETHRIAVPPTPECFGTPPPRRGGNVRLDDQGRLEVRLQRNFESCAGYEVQYVYEAVAPDLLPPEAIIRRYALYFTQGDVDHMVRLFAQTGSLLEPFTNTPSGDHYRHEGLESIEGWFRETFETAPWRTWQVTAINSPETGAAGMDTREATFEYADPHPHLDGQPLVGSTTFTIAAGEIFELRIDVASDEEQGEGEEGGDAEDAEES